MPLVFILTHIYIVNSQLPLNKVSVRSRREVRSGDQLSNMWYITVYQTPPGQTNKYLFSMSLGRGTRDTTYLVRMSPVLVLGSV